jgi:hypothetical protein
MCSTMIFWGPETLPISASEHGVKTDFLLEPLMFRNHTSSILPYAHSAYLFWLQILLQK